MSLTIEFKCPDGEVGNPVVTIPYDDGDYHIKALHTDCVLQARKYGENYIKKILEPLCCAL